MITNNYQFEQYKKQCESKVRISTYNNNNILENILTKQQNTFDETNSMSKGLIVLDDYYLDDDYLYNELIFKLLLDRKHYDLTVIITNQSYLRFPRNLRLHVDYLITFNDEFHNNLRAMYDDYFQYIDSYELFKTILKNHTLNNNCVIVDNKSNDATINRYFYYKTIMN